MLKVFKLRSSAEIKKMTKPPKLIHVLAAAFQDAVTMNSAVQVKPGAVLWTDAGAQLIAEEVSARWFDCGRRDHAGRHD